MSGISVLRYVNSWQYLLARICLIVDVSVRFLFCSVVAYEMKCDVRARVSIERDNMEVTSHYFYISLPARRLLLSVPVPKFRTGDAVLM